MAHAGARPNRRTVLIGGAAGLVGGLALARPASADPVTPAGSGPLPRLAPLPAGAPARTAFAPAEQRYAPYLVTLADMVNDIDDSDTELRGFMTGGWWRTPSEPFNARIMEHVATLAWFHGADRPWNPYRHDPALLARLDAAVGYYLRLQHDDGSWPEYAPDERSRAATAFALGYLSKTLHELRDAGVLPDRGAEISAALHRAMTWFLDPANTGVWQDGMVEFANQPAAGLAGAAKALDLDPDAGLRRLLDDRIAYFAAHAQSPAGFLYEPRGMDIAYNLNVTLTELHEIHTEVGAPVLLPVVRRLAEWLTYTVVPEPDGAGLVSFASGAARTPMYFLDAVTPDRQQRDLGSVFCRSVPQLRVFYPAREERDAQRAAWAADSSPVPVLAPGDTNPRIPANIPYGEGYPTRRQRDVAIAGLPAVRFGRFTELRVDPQDQHYLFLRRPSYYLQAFLGTRPNGVVRAGLGLLWHPAAGTFVHGGQSSNTECWATVLPNGGTDGASNLTPVYHDGPAGSGPVVAPDLVATVRGDLGLRWTTAGGNVTVAALFTDAGLVREIATTMDAVEQVPLVLRPDDDVRWSTGDEVVFGTPAAATAGSLTITRGGVTLTVDWGRAAGATVTPAARTYFLDGSRRLHVLRVPHGRAGRIAYTFTST
ncbi:hypothetical protein [Jiangella anatolica]|uniref:Silent information regulator protein Sir2 n=1 Tax=Jiangella anatolica TaxID=2670374 RepID=A0A2W2C1Y0_9ACTN|nr:hypothetical protein [Jiangella anatolica]PZF79746.1 hypothetical protein C1I92_29625 [Jiangella anatolica]